MKKYSHKIQDKIDESVGDAPHREKKVKAINYSKAMKRLSKAFKTKKLKEKAQRISQRQFKVRQFSQSNFSGGILR